MSEVPGVVVRNNPFWCNHGSRLFEVKKGVIMATPCTQRSCSRSQECLLRGCQALFAPGDPSGGCGALRDTCRLYIVYRHVRVSSRLGGAPVRGAGPARALSGSTWCVLAEIEMN